eukprot:Amastigsp_a511374_167.p3 type:complete len:180 gc:universal Amastigsp_a511374_167:1252-713(-)
MPHAKKMTMQMMVDARSTIAPAKRSHAWRRPSLKGCFVNANARGSLGTSSGSSTFEGSFSDSTVDASASVSASSSSAVSSVESDSCCSPATSAFFLMTSRAWKNRMQTYTMGRTRSANAAIDRIAIQPARPAAHEMPCKSTNQRPKYTLSDTEPAIGRSHPHQMARMPATPVIPTATKR